MNSSAEFSTLIIILLYVSILGSIQHHYTEEKVLMLGLYTNQYHYTTTKYLMLGARATCPLNNEAHNGNLS